MEKKDTPVWIERALLNVGGRAPDGEPRFRVIWGGNRLCVGDDHVLYHPYKVDRWHLEKRLNGEWEHCYCFGQCPHMLLGDKQWCNACILSGGEFLELETHFRIVERCVRLIIASENFGDAAKQRQALEEREQKKQDEKRAKIEDVVHGVGSHRPRRSFEAPLHVAAKDTPLGESLGFRQVSNAKEN